VYVRLNSAKSRDERQAGVCHSRNPTMQHFNDEWICEKINKVQTTQYLKGRTPRQQHWWYLVYQDMRVVTLKYSFSSCMPHDNTINCRKHSITLGIIAGPQIISVLFILFFFRMDYGRRNRNAFRIQVEKGKNLQCSCSKSFGI